MSGCITIDRANLARFASVVHLGTPSMVEVHETPHSRFYQPPKWFASSAPKLSPRTEQILRCYDQDVNAIKRPQVALAQMSESILMEPTLDKHLAYAELAVISAERAKATREEALALDLFGAAMVHSYQFLLDERFAHVRNPYDPAFQSARDIYNASLEGLLRILSDRGELRPGEKHTVTTSGQKFHIACVARGPWGDDEFERFEFVSDYRVTGIRNRHQTFGLGVPLIAVRRKQPLRNPVDRYYPEGLAIPVTAFVRVTPGESDGVKLCSLELYDPLTTREVRANGRVARLQSDLTTPLAFFLNNPVVRTQTLATFAFLDANFGKELRGLYMLEPYQSNKIPVVMVHGLLSSPTTWVEMFNDLRSDPTIRDNYQFWFYLYPTGQPFWVSASDMREDLAQARQTLDPTGHSPTINEMVLVGHSMGGLVSKMQTIDSGQDFWRILSDQPFDQLKAEHATREQLARTLFFRADPSIRRVITIATPHRGSDFANSTTQWLTRSLVKIPELLTFPSEDLMRDNPDFFRDTKLLRTRTSVESLDPSCPMFQQLLAAKKSSWVKYHNLVGTTESTKSVAKIGTALIGAGDGVVELASAQLDEVESQVVVQADHINAHRHPQSILEVRRILLEHLRAVRPTHER